MIKVKKDIGGVYFDDIDRTLSVDIYKFLNIPGLFMYEKKKEWFLSNDGKHVLNMKGFRNKDMAAKAAKMFLKDFDLKKDFNTLSRNPLFKIALKKLNAAIQF